MDAAVGLGENDLVYWDWVEDQCPPGLDSQGVGFAAQPVPPRVSTSLSFVDPS